MSKSDFLENKLLDHVLRNVAYTPPSSVFVALYTVAPGEAGGGTEVSGGSYARTAAAFSAASGGTISNSAAVNFPQATASWGTVTAFGLFDAATAGNLLYSGNLGVSKAVGSGDNVQIAIGQLTVSED